MQHLRVEGFIVLDFAARPAIDPTSRASITSRSSVHHSPTDAKSKQMSLKPSDGNAARLRATRGIPVWQANTISAGDDAPTHRLSSKVQQLAVDFLEVGLMQAVRSTLHHQSAAFDRFVCRLPCG
jgi:hypothetical protein